VNRARVSTIAQKLPDRVRSFVQRFHEKGFECFLVGGAVRNLILGHRPSDFDFATNATPQEVISSFRRVIPTGIDHGTVTVLHQGQSYEVTTYRVESDYSDARHPDAVEFVRDIFEDLKRRDFTINAMAFDPVARTFLDPHGGEDDIKARTIRTVGEPAERFAEDSLRMLRAVRFASQLEFEIDRRTLEEITNRADRIAAVSYERVRDELTKLLQSRTPSCGIILMKETRLLDYVVPELAECVGVEQRGRHRYDVFEHSLRACDAAPADNLVVRLAALLHDVGKPRALETDEWGNRRFHGHDRISAEMAEELLKRLRYPHRVVGRVVHLVRQHMFNYTPEWTDAAVRRFVARVGADAIPDLIALRAADSEAIRGERVDARPLGDFSERIQRQIATDQAFTVRDLAVNGHDLMEAGIPPGPTLGVVLNALLETVLDDPRQNTRERLVEIALRFYRERIHEPER
jgi:poly(A) polymerase/tRNA nucleotidyltransferase (CCA-adding enzyme)